MGGGAHRLPPPRLRTHSPHSRRAPAPRQDRTAAGAPPSVAPHARQPPAPRPPRGSRPPWARWTQPPRARGRFQEAEPSRLVPDSPVGSCCPESTLAINAPRLPSGSPRAPPPLLLPSCSCRVLGSYGVTPLPSWPLGSLGRLAGLQMRAMAPSSPRLWGAVTSTLPAHPLPQMPALLLPHCGPLVLHQAHRPHVGPASASPLN